ncbi:MAG: hemolysin III family protein [Ilumatobacter sp.]|uniref:PAQR family membrane homeostasis protein TrhA n=1 Tax=Ilumatobacter sp. TaxID=1967498 RepID=UPI003C742BDF
MTSSADSTDRPAWRGRMHAGAFFIAIPAGIALVTVAERAAARTAASIYVVSLLVMLGMSAAYHRLARSPAARRWMQRLDHAGIYVLIAGTYVPMTIVAMPLAWGIPVLSVIAGAAVVGIAVKLSGFARLQRAAYVLYPAMGWAVVIALPVLFDSLTGLQFSLVVAGGLVYTLGIPVLVWKRPDPWPSVFGYHEIWHTFVVVAAALHFAAVASLLA